MPGRALPRAFCQNIKKKKGRKKKKKGRKKKPQCRQSYLESSDVTATWLARSSNSACKKKEF